MAVVESEGSGESMVMVCIGSLSIGTIWPEKRHSGELLDILFNFYDAIDIIVPSTPSSFTSTKTIPIIELLASSFLSQYDDETLPSYTIWDLLFSGIELNL